MADRSMEDAGAPPRSPDHNGRESFRPGSDAWGGMRKGLAELFQYFSHYLTARRDLLELSLKKAAVGAGTVLVALFAAAGLAATLGSVMVLFLLRGAAQGLGALFGGRPWLGELAVGLLFFLAAGGAGACFLRKMGKASRRRLRRKYAEMKLRQSAELGTNVEEKAAASGLHE